MVATMPGPAIKAAIDAIPDPVIAPFRVISTLV